MSKRNTVMYKIEINNFFVNQAKTTLNIHLNSIITSIGSLIID